MKNIEELRALLGGTMQKVLDGGITTDQARTVALLAKVVCETVRVEINLAEATDGDFKGSGFIDVTPRKVQLR